MMINSYTSFSRAEPDLIRSEQNDFVPKRQGLSRANAPHIKLKVKFKF